MVNFKFKYVMCLFLIVSKYNICMYNDLVFFLKYVFLIIIGLNDWNFEKF